MDIGGDLMTQYFISDLHFGDEFVRKIDKRPFDNLREMRETIISNWNNVVCQEDEVYILGDMFHKSIGQDEGLCILDRLNGHKFYIRGNHEEAIDNMDPRGVNRRLTILPNIASIKSNHWKIVMSHYPMISHENSFSRSNDKTIHLYGHVHDSIGEKICSTVRAEYLQADNLFYSINVGAMMKHMNYEPKTLEKLLETVIAEEGKQ